MTVEVFDLERFVTAQAPVYGQVVSELKGGKKRGHWMWFVFPQLRGLGRSAMSAHYGIASAAEAAAYLEHALLGPRLRECTSLVVAIERATLLDVFGSPDDMKFKSCMTLFAHVAADADLFRAALDRYCAGQFDSKTLDLLERAAANGRRQTEQRGP
jgi:uncharacterized protein (DUF1810 family)